MQLERHDLDIRGLPTVYRGGSGRPLVFLHTAGGLQPDNPFLVRLSEEFEVIAPLAPGFRDLGELDDILDVRDLALHYDDVFESLGLEQALVVGYSFGGMVGAELAAHYPKRVADLVLIAPVGLWLDEHPTADLFATPVVELDDLLWEDQEARAAYAAAAGTGAAQGNGASAGAASDDADNRADHVEALLETSRGLSVLAKFLWPIPDKGLSRRLHRVTARTLILWGEADRLVPVEHAAVFEQLIADARVTTFAGAGHALPLERTDEVFDTIRTFLE